MTDETALAAPARELAVSGLQWLVEQARETPAGLVWTAHADDDELDPTLYSGGAGNVLTLLEAARDLDDGRYADVARDAVEPYARISRSRRRNIAAIGTDRMAPVETTEHASLYFGRTGIAVALHALGQ